jgi:hypothetical protein
VYAEEAASDDDDDDGDDDGGDSDDYDMDYSLEDKMPSRSTHGKKQHLKTVSEDRHKHSHEKLEHQAELTSGSPGMIHAPFLYYYYYYYC